MRLTRSFSAFFTTSSSNLASARPAARRLGTLSLGRKNVRATTRPNGKVFIRATSALKVNISSRKVKLSTGAIKNRSQLKKLVYLGREYWTPVRTSAILILIQLPKKQAGAAGGGYGEIRNPCGRMCVMFEGPTMVIVWLSTPAVVVFGSFVLGLGFHGISKLWAAGWLHRA